MSSTVNITATELAVCLVVKAATLVGLTALLLKQYFQSATKVRKYYCYFQSATKVLKFLFEI